MFYYTQEKINILTFKNKKEQPIHILELFSYFRSPRSIDITVSCSFVLRSFHIPRTSFCFSVRFSELSSRKNCDNVTPKATHIFSSVISDGRFSCSGSYGTYNSTLYVINYYCPFGLPLQSFLQQIYLLYRKNNMKISAEIIKILPKHRKQITEITETTLPIGQIALQTGFSQQSYFGKCFREKMNCSPREYRKNRTECRFV